MNIELDKKEVFVLLYLLHKSDYGYEMKKNFRKFPLGKGMSYLKHDKIYDVCKKLEKKNLIIRLKLKKNWGGRGKKNSRRVYIISPNFFSNLLDITGKVPIMYNDFGLNLLELIRNTSKDINSCIAGIMKFKKYDFMTVVVHIKDILWALFNYDSIYIDSSVPEYKEAMEADMISNNFSYDFIDMNKIDNGLNVLRNRFERNKELCKKYDINLGTLKDTPFVLSETAFISMLIESIDKSIVGLAVRERIGSNVSTPGVDADRDKLEKMKSAESNMEMPF